MIPLAEMSPARDVARQGVNGDSPRQHWLKTWNKNRRSKAVIRKMNCTICTGVHEIWTIHILGTTFSLMADWRIIPTAHSDVRTARADPKQYVTQMLRCYGKWGTNGGFVSLHPQCRTVNLVVSLWGSSFSFVSPNSEETTSHLSDLRIYA
jgi:hypothetical protein